MAAQQTLAAHETMDMHELMNMKTLCLIKSKNMMEMATDRDLVALLKKDVEQSAKDLDALKSLYSRAMLS